MPKPPAKPAARVPLYLVSACLAGRACRYDGTACPVPELKRLVEAGLALTVCPEELGGLPTPRPPVEIRQGRAMDRNGRDVTAQFEQGAEAVVALARARNIRRAILKERSPSCGCGLIYDGTFSRCFVAGDGITVAKLRRAGVIVRGESDYAVDPNFFSPGNFPDVFPPK